MTKITRENFLKLLFETRSAIRKEIELSKYFDNDLLEYNFDEDFEAIEIYCQGVSNGFLAEIFEAITGLQVEVIGEVEKLYDCPCCELKTLTEIYNTKEGTGYDICPYCNWEDDGTTETNIRSSVNKGTIDEYRKKIKDNPNKYYKNKWF